MSAQNSVELFDPAKEKEPLGKSWNGLIASWWSWCMSIPIHDHPMFKHDIKRNGKQARQPIKITPPAENSVIFLTGHHSGIAERTCEIDSGNGIFFPVAACECSKAEFPDYNKEELEKYAKDGNQVIHMEVDIGGVRLNKQQLENKYKFEGPFDLDINKIHKNNIFEADNQVNSKEAYSVGYWLFVKPLMKGTKFDLIFSQDTEDNAPSRTFNCSFAVTYHITVV